MRLSLSSSLHILKLYLTPVKHEYCCVYYEEYQRFMELYGNNVSALEEKLNSVDNLLSELGFYSIINYDNVFDRVYSKIEQAYNTLYKVSCTDKELYIIIMYIWRVCHSTGSAEFVTSLVTDNEIVEFDVWLKDNFDNSDEIVKALLQNIMTELCPDNHARFNYSYGPSGDLLVMLKIITCNHEEKNLKELLDSQLYKSTRKIIKWLRR